MSEECPDCDCRSNVDLEAHQLKIRTLRGLIKEGDFEGAASQGKTLWKYYPDFRLLRPSSEQIEKIKNAKKAIDDFRSMLAVARDQEVLLLKALGDVAEHLAAGRREANKYSQPFDGEN